MSGTNHSTGGLRRITPLRASVKCLVAGSVLVLMVAVAFVVWIERSSRSQFSQLQAELAAIRAERFYLGVHLRAGVWRLDGRLLRFQLSEDFDERDNFNMEARELAELIEKTMPHLTMATEHETALQLKAAFEVYLQDTAPLLTKGVRGIRRDTAAQLSDEISAKSKQLLRLCEDLVRAQHAAWDALLLESQDSLANLNQLLRFSAFFLFVLLALILALIVALIYRAFVVPLRSRLTESQAVIERQEKLASLGTLAAGVAHEIRNPLTAIKFRLFSLKKSLPPAYSNVEDVQVINSEINRLERIVKDFLEFARPAEPELASVSTGRVLQGVRDLLESELAKQRIQLIVESSDSTWIKADQHQIKQVLINLIQNAADSIGTGGSVTLRARKGMARLAQGHAPAVIIEVVDTGKGIPPEVEERLFDPFFSSKEGGTGLGLPIAGRIAEKHGGYIQYQTQRNRGTTFSIVLPRQTDHAGKDTAD